MALLLGILGICAGTALVLLLLLNTRSEALRLWPPPGPWSWQSTVFWALFRTLNLSSLSIAALLWSPQIFEDPLRFGAALSALAGGSVYLFACISLGRSNLYGGTAGLVTSGIYAWTRNPQYALAMPTYVALALAVQSMSLWALVGLLVAVYVLMAINEEPWLEAAYGEPYRRYRQRVRRFYDVRRVHAAVRHLGRRLTSVR